MWRARIAALLFCLCWGAAAAKAEGDRVLFNGKIFTGDPAHPYAEAVAIRGEKILAAGTRGEVSRAASPSASLIDLKGHLLLPGLIDSHCHALHGGIALISANVDENISSMDALVRAVADAKKSGKGMQGDILVVGGIPLAFWSKLNNLNRSFNSNEYAEQMVMLRGMDGHTAWANRALLKRAGVDKKFISGLDTPGRGYYGIGADTGPNGFLVDAGVDKVEGLIPPPPDDCGGARSCRLFALIGHHCMARSQGGRRDLRQLPQSGSER